MDSRERVTVAATLPHLSQSRSSGGVGGAGAGVPGVGGVAAEGMFRNLQSNGNAYRGSTLERPVGRTVVHPQASAGPAGHLVTTTADVEHHQPRPDLRSPLPADSSPYPVFDTNQMLTKKIVVRRHDNHGFGFTLRHFIVYPPEPGSQAPQRYPQALRVTEPMDTVFVKDVRPNGPAHAAGLKTGDRLWTVNGLPVDGMQYAHVVSIIQQVPQLLTLQIIPKEFDFLQTQFGETAHNPETNQRPRLCAPVVGANSGYGQQQVQAPQQVAQQHPSAFVTHPSSHPSSNTSLQQQPHQHVQLQSPNVAAAAAAAGVQLHSPQNRRESLASLSSYDSSMKEIEESNAAIAMLRLKKNIEQKEEFMRRPNQQQMQQMIPQQVMPYAMQGQPQSASQPMQVRRLTAAASPALASAGVEVNGQVMMPREFYSRPKKLQRPVWPPTMDEQQQQHFRKLEQNHFVPIHSPTPAQQMQQSKLMKSKCREQFFNMLQQNEGGSGSGDDSMKDQKADEYPIPANGLHIVSEKTRLFESGRPLSPDGSCVDRTLLYKSELSRLNQKVAATPNVALRRKEYEQIHEHSDYSRLSTDTETIVSDTASVRQLQSPPLLSPTHQQQRISLHSGVPEDLPPVVVVRREPKQGTAGAANDGISEDDRRMRRISYLRATANDTNLEINNNSLTAESNGGGNSSEYAENDRAVAMNVISDNRDKRRHGRQLAEGEAEAIKDTVGGEYNDTEMALLLRGDKRRESILALHEGPMQIKIKLLDGKRYQDRSWKSVWAELKGNRLNWTVQREGKQSQSLGGPDLSNYLVMDATDYTKRKHVFKLLSRPPLHPSTTATNGQTEILVQAENDSQMSVWRDLLKSVSDRHDSLLKKDCVVQDTQHQVAEPQSGASTKVIETPSPNLSDDVKTSTGAGQGRKYYLGSRSPSGQSPVTKSRKTPQQLNISVGGNSSFGDKNKDGGSDKEAGSPKPRAWKLLVAKQLRKIQGQGSAPVSFPEAASIGVPLQFCVPSEDDEYVPLLVARCTGIVEEKGLDIVGVYRIPGNTANITALTELVNRGFDETTLADHRWDDVNVVSSLLKAFLRQLPEPLIPDEMYPNFINADKKRGEVRLLELKDHLDNLPVHNYHTMRHLMRHLYRVSENCSVNLMDPKNIAIVFGPSVVRMSKQTLELAVKDMKHQCCIVEVLVSQYRYFFDNGPMPVISELSSPTADSVSSVPNTNLLLDNVAKLEPMGERNSSSSIVGSIVQAANRKLRKNRKTILSSGGTPDNLSLDSSTSTESKDVGAIYSTIERKDGDRLKGHPAQGHDEDQPDSMLQENGSMSLNTVTITLDNKLRSLRSSMDENTTDGDDDEDDEQQHQQKHLQPPGNAKRKSAGDSGLEKHQSLFKTNKWKVKHFNKNQPLTVFDDNIPYADESPERSMAVIPGSTVITSNAASVPVITTTNTTGPRLPIRQNSFKNAVSGGGVGESGGALGNSDLKQIENQNNSDQGVDGLSSTSSDETDTSTTSSVQMTVDPEMLRKMNRILTNLERNTTKMNRSLSLNYKNVQKGGDCCCHVNHRLMNRASAGGVVGVGSGVGVVTSNSSSGLTKDEKTDKNNMKKRHSQEGALNGMGKGQATASATSGSGGMIARRYGNRSIRRRHTVGGTHDYSPRGGAGGENYRTPCHNYVMHRSSSPE